MTDKSTESETTEQNTALTWAELNDDVTAGRESPFDTQGEKDVADRLKAANDSMEPIDFGEAAGLGSKDALRPHHCVWVVVHAAVATLRMVGLDLGFVNGTFHLFTGTHWRQVETAIVRIFLIESALMFGLKRAEACYHRFVSDAVKQAETELLVVPRIADTSSPMINYRNGTLEFDGAVPTLRAHRKEDFFFYALECDYDEQADCPKFKNYLGFALPDEPSQQNLGEFAGSVFHPLRHEKALFCTGPAGTGKSVFFEVVSSVIGEYNVTHFSLESLGTPAYRAMLPGKLLNYASEIGKGMNSEVFKKIVSGEPLEARLLFQNAIIIRRLPRLAFNCNELPRDIEISDAYFRRLLIVVFDQKVPDELRIHDLARQIVEDEKAGVMNWVIDGLRRLIQQQGFTPNPKADGALAEYRTDTDSVALFQEEYDFRSTDGSKGRYIGIKRLYTIYSNFCVSAGFKALKRTNMVRRFLDLGFEKKKKNVGWALCIETDDAHVNSLPPF